eukprot:NODE_236_length_11993_cov_1.471078.p1 type:complete len:837 gc:universal NODE_236_length_11993_cov_1.471078:5247-7757(+)
MVYLLSQLHSLQPLKCPAVNSGTTADIHILLKNTCIVVSCSHIYHLEAFNSKDSRNNRETLIPRFCNQPEKITPHHILKHILKYVESLKSKEFKELETNLKDMIPIITNQPHKLPTILILNPKHFLQKYEIKDGIIRNFTIQVISPPSNTVDLYDLTLSQISAIQQLQHKEFKKFYISVFFAPILVKTPDKSANSCRNHINNHFSNSYAHVYRDDSSETRVKRVFIAIVTDLDTVESAKQYAKSCGLTTCDDDLLTYFFTAVGAKDAMRPNEWTQLEESGTLRSRAVLETIADRMVVKYSMNLEQSSLKQAQADLQENRVIYNSIAKQFQSGDHSNATRPFQVKIQNDPMKKDIQIPKDELVHIYLKNEFTEIYGPDYSTLEVEYKGMTNSKQIIGIEDNMTAKTVKQMGVQYFFPEILVQSINLEFGQRYGRINKFTCDFPFKFYIYSNWRIDYSDILRNSTIFNSFFYKDNATALFTYIDHSNTLKSITFPIGLYKSEIYQRMNEQFPLLKSNDLAIFPPVNGSVLYYRNVIKKMRMRGGSNPNQSQSASINTPNTRKAPIFHESSPIKRPKHIQVNKLVPEKRVAELSSSNNKIRPSPYLNKFLSSNLNTFTSDAPEHVEDPPTTLDTPEMYTANFQTNIKIVAYNCCGYKRLHQNQEINNILVHQPNAILLQESRNKYNLQKIPNYYQIDLPNTNLQHKQHLYLHKSVSDIQKVHIQDNCYIFKIHGTLVAFIYIPYELYRTKNLAAIKAILEPAIRLKCILIGDLNFNVLEMTNITDNFSKLLVRTFTEWSYTNKNSKNSNYDTDKTYSRSLLGTFVQRIFSELFYRLKSP